jgi:hypothetical protein
MADRRPEGDVKMRVRSQEVLISVAAKMIPKLDFAVLKRKKL